MCTALLVLSLFPLLTTGVDGGDGGSLVAGDEQQCLILKTGQDQQLGCGRGCMACASQSNPPSCLNMLDLAGRGSCLRLRKWIARSKKGSGLVWDHTMLPALSLHLSSARSLTFHPSPGLHLPPPYLLHYQSRAPLGKAPSPLLLTLPPIVKG